MTKSLTIAALFLVACSGSSPGTDGGTDAAATDAGTDVATASDASGDAAACVAPQGTTCPTTAGNCKHIGDPCTKGGNQCISPTVCDVDLDPTGVGICITFAACQPNMHACGTGATCCKTAMTSNVPVCLPNQCLPSDCTAEP